MPSPLRSRLIGFFVLLLQMPAMGAEQFDLPEWASEMKVGPANMPAAVEPILAPFEMPELQRPDFGGRQYKVALQDCHRSGDLITPVVQQAIDQASAEGGGTVTLPAGEWQTGRIQLKSGVCLHVPQATTLRFSGAVEDYLPVVPARYEGLEVMSAGGLVYAHQAQRIGLTGRGKLLGPKSGPMRKAWPGLTDKMVDVSKPVTQRVMDGQQGRHYVRPQFIFFMHCQDVLIQGITLQNGPMWNVVPTFCDRVLIRGVTIESRGVVNGDGVDIESSRNVLVEYCKVNTGDDCFAMKAGRGPDGLKAGKPVENVVLRHNHAIGGYGGITCGSETGAGIRDVYLHDCQFDDVRHAVYMKTRRPRGGGGERITVERVRFSSYEHGLFFDMIGSPMFVGDLGRRLPVRAITPLTPYYRDITLRRIVGTCSGGDAFKIKGIPESPATGVLLEDIQISAPGLTNLRDARQVTMRHCTLRADQPKLRFLDATDVKFENCRFETDQESVQLLLVGEATSLLQFKDCWPVNAKTPIETKNGAKSDAVQVVAAANSTSS